MDTILFDLDGTLLPMDQEAFTKIYFNEITKKCAQHGFNPEEVGAAIWAGTKAMVKNDGSQTNENIFWQTFAQILGQKVLMLKPVLNAFYAEEFCKAEAATTPNPLAAKLVAHLKAKGYTLVLASSPVFPAIAYRTRLGWLGLKPEDFALITCYEDFNYCKPNPEYYKQILRKIAKEPQQCLMVGNDLHEDGAAKTVGIDFHLITQGNTNAEKADYCIHKNSSFEDFFKAYISL